LYGRVIFPCNIDENLIIFVKLCFNENANYTSLLEAGDHHHPIVALSNARLKCFSIMGLDDPINPIAEWRGT
jgi:hypothetical protein